MKVRLAYGKEGLWIDLPHRNAKVVEPPYARGLSDEAEAMRGALRSPIGSPPLRDVVQSHDTVAVVFSDLTRPQPRDRMLPVLLDEISHIPRSQIVLINALGTHRPNTPDELAGMLGREIAAGYRIVQHDAWANDLTPVGRTSFGHDVAVNREYMRASVRILTGFIEPHLFAGFSGGPKAVLPGIVNQGAVLGNHDARMIGDPRATWGITSGNPVWEEMRDAALLTSPTFLLNVTLNRDKEITAVFAGDMLQAHAAGMEFASRAAMVPVPKLFDIVITSNSGYPLDLNLYQAVKGMSAAAQVVKPGGSILVAAECWDGIPDHGEFKRLLQMASTPRELLDIIAGFESPIQDQWQAQVQAQVQLKADVYVKNSHLDAATLRSVLLNPCESVGDTVAALLARYGPDASICVLPEGPMTIPYVKRET